MRQSAVAHDNREIQCGVGSVSRTGPATYRTGRRAEVVKAATLRTLLFVERAAPGFWVFVAALRQETVEEILVRRGRHTWYAMTYHYLTLLAATGRQNDGGNRTEMINRPIASGPSDGLGAVDELDLAIRTGRARHRVVEDQVVGPAVEVDGDFAS